MPSRKTLLLLSGYLLLVGATTLSVWRMPPRHFITRANCDMIREGMTEDQVVQLLGVPAGNYASGEWLYLGPGVQKFYSGRLDFKTWVGDEVLIDVGFDESGHVWRADIMVCQHDEVGNRIRTDESLLDRLRLWLKRLRL
jgi:outer membrane protein assembly factor BamE (lipoprotein component of BamABCDE complex)